MVQLLTPSKAWELGLARPRGVHVLGVLAGGPGAEIGVQTGDVLLEAFASGRELTCSVLAGEALPLVCIEPDGDFYDYHAKYLSDATRYLCPAPVDAALTTRIQEMALAAFAAIGARHWGRVDFMLDGSGEPQLLEINTLPGMTTHSLVPMAAQAAGMNFEALCWRLLELTMEDAS